MMGGGSLGEHTKPRGQCHVPVMPQCFSVVRHCLQGLELHCAKITLFLGLISGRQASTAKSFWELGLCSVYLLQQNPKAAARNRNPSVDSV